MLAIIALLLSAEYPPPATTTVAFATSRRRATTMRSRAAQSSTVSFNFELGAVVTASRQAASPGEKVSGPLAGMGPGMVWPTASAPPSP